MRRCDNYEYEGIGDAWTLKTRRAQEQSVTRVRTIVQERTLYGQIKRPVLTLYISIRGPLSRHTLSNTKNHHEPRWPMK